jgi:2-methylcitrate dehydratase PrpD
MNNQEITDGSETGPQALTRRSLFRGMGLLLAAAAVLPVQRLSAAEEDSPSGPPMPVDDTIINQLSAYMAAAAEREIPPEVTEKAKHHILDTLVAMVSGADLPPAKVAFKYAAAYARSDDESKVATVVGSKLLLDPGEAALVNGVLAHSDETDDSHAPGHTHPGCAVVPAALAAAERSGVSGTRFIRAVTLGYDIGPRFTMALGGLKFQMATHRSSHSIANNFGAAAAAGCATGLNAQQMRWAIEYAAQQAAGTAAWMRDINHISKALIFGGRPARNGVTSSFWIKLGADGVNNILSGDDNFFIAMSPTANPAKLIEKLGERYEVTRTNIKKWSVGSPIQAPLDALENLRKKHPFEADDVKQVVVRVASSEARTVDNRTMANISMQHLVALMLVDKTVSFKASHDQDRMAEPAILRQRAKVQLIHDEALERLYPQRQAIVEITFNDGSTLSERITAVSGSAENPMTREQVTRKASDLMTPYLGQEKCGRLIEAIFDLENLADIRALRPLLQVG